MKSWKIKLPWEKIAIILFLILTSYNIFSVVYQQRQQYFSHNYWQRYSQLKQTYLDSQYVNKHPKGWIPDQTALSYAGGAFVQGVNPVLIIADTPPLGKYLIGLSAVLFDNENIISLFFGVVSLFFIFLLGKQIFKNYLFAFLLPCLVSLEPIFKNQLIYTPLLDNIQLAFLLGSFYFFNKGIKGKKTYLFFSLAMILTGCFIATKFFITGLPILGAFAAVLLFNKDKKRLIPFAVTTPLTVLVLFLSYVRIFAFGYSIRSLLGIQKYIFLYHKSQLILPFSIWPLLLFNRWYVWFGNKPVISDSQWSISWPIVTVFSFIIIVLYLLKKLKHTITIEVCMWWLIFYVLLFSFGQITSRYLVIYIPILYLVSLYGIERLVYKNS